MRRTQPGVSYVWLRERLLTALCSTIWDTSRGRFDFSSFSFYLFVSPNDGSSSVMTTVNTELSCYMYIS